MLKTILSFTSWLVADQVVWLGVGIVVSIAVARYLRPRQFGIYSIVLATVAIASCLVPLAADTIVVRELAKRPDDASVILGPQVLPRLFGAYLAAAAAIVAVVWQASDAGNLWIMALVAGSALLFRPFDAIGAASRVGRLAKRSWRS